MIEDVYKVVLEREGVLGSLTSSYPYPLGILTYEPYEWTKPKIGRILAFDTKKNALLFMDDLTNWINGPKSQLWLCQGKVTAPPADPVLMQPFLFMRSQSKETLDKLMERSWAGKDVYGDKLVEPIGTVYCSEIRLLELIRDYT